MSSARFRADGQHLAPQPLLHRLADALRQRRLELLRRRRRAPRPPSRERRSAASKRPSSSAASLRARLGDALLGAFQCLFVHGRQGYSGRRMRSVRARLRAPAGADRAASGGPARRLAAARLRPRDRRRSGIAAFAELPDELDGELVVVNDTRVVPARLALRRASGGAAEVLLRRARSATVLWEALARPVAAAARRRAARRRCELLEPLGEGRWRVRLEGEPARRARRCRRTSPSRSPTRRATRRSTRARPGSAAAPTAGPPLHAGAARRASTSSG